MVTMSAVWDRTSEFLSDNVGAVVTVAALAIYLPDTIQTIVQPLAVTAAPLGRLGIGLLSLVLSLVSVLGQVALIALALDPVLGSNGAFALGVKRWPAMLGVSLALLLALIVLGLPPALLALADGVDLTALSAGTAPNLGPGTALIIVLYFLIIVPVVIWAGARLAVVGPVVVAERRGLGAIGRAFALTRGLAGKIVGVIILFAVVSLVAVLAAQTVFGSILRIALGNVGPINAASVLTALIVGIVSTALTVMANAFLAKLYVAVRDRSAAVPATA